MSGRIRHLDALRAFSMLFGLFVHAEMLFAVAPFPLVYLVSSYFRMAVFFLASGFLVSLVAVRTSQGAMVRRRTLALMLPFCAMLALVHPFTLWLVRIRNDGPVPLGEFLSSEWVPTQLLHLWFLPALWAYVLLEPLLALVLGLPALRRLARAAATWRPDALMLPFCAMGVMLRTTPALFERFHRVSPPALAAGVALAFVVDRMAPAFPPAVLTGMEVFTRAALTLPIVSALLWICRALFSGPSRTVGALTDSVYTVYLFHYLALFAAALLLAPVFKSNAALYFACVALAFSATFALHWLVIARVPILRLLFNGQPQSTRVPAA